MTLTDEEANRIIQFAKWADDHRRERPDSDKCPTCDRRSAEIITLLESRIGT